MVLNVSDQGTRRTRVRAGMFDDLPYDYYAVLPPWYQPMTPSEVMDYFLALADALARPVVIYNAPWVSNQLTFAQVRTLAEHPRIVGCKDVTPALARGLEFPEADRLAVDFSYLHGSDQISTSTDLGSDGFVSALSNAYPELAVAMWDASRAGDAERAFRHQSHFLKLARATTFGPMLACLEVMMKDRGFLDRMLPSPLRSLDEAAARRVLEVVESVGVRPVPAAGTVGSYRT
jgi:dihydrodipicolinate synthase/N-acetylneuraminate lyase